MYWSGWKPSRCQRLRSDKRSPYRTPVHMIWADREAGDQYQWVHPDEEKVTSRDAVYEAERQTAGVLTEQTCTG
jgi:hypothetical protein